MGDCGAVVVVDQRNIIIIATQGNRQIELHDTTAASSVLRSDCLVQASTACESVGWQVVWSPSRYRLVQYVGVLTWIKPQRNAIAKFQVRVMKSPYPNLINCICHNCIRLTGGGRNPGNQSNLI